MISGETAKSIPFDATEEAYGEIIELRIREVQSHWSDETRADKCCYPNPDWCVPTIARVQRRWEPPETDNKFFTPGGRAFPKIQTPLNESVTMPRPAKRKTSRGRNSERAAAVSREAQPISQTAVALDCPLHAITPHPKNPRSTFDPGALQQLADSMARNGILQPIVVREVGAAQYQLLAGERRWRAAKQLQWDTIPCRVIECDDVQALEILGEENLKRGDLNPMELAAYCGTLLAPTAEGGAGKTQDDVAGQLGHTRSWVSNTVRLLELPAEWRERVAVGELDHTKARTLIPYAHVVWVMEALNRVYQQTRAGWPRLDPELTRSDWDRRVEAVVAHCTRSIDRKKKRWQCRDYSVSWESFACVIPKAEFEEHRQALDIVTIGGEEVATNFELFDTLQLAEVKRRVAKRKNPTSKPAAGKPQTPAQLKAAEKEKADAKKHVQRERVRKWRIEWLRWILGGRVQPAHWQTQKALLYLIWERPLNGFDMEHAITLAVNGAGGKVKNVYGGVDEFASLCSVLDGATASETEQKARRDKGEVMASEFLSEILWPVDPKRPPCFLPEEFVENLAENYDLDLAAEWAELQQDDELGIFAAFFALHTRDQLEALAKELRVDISSAKKRDDVLACFVPGKLKLPKLVKKVKASK